MAENEIRNMSRKKENIGESANMARRQKRKISVMAYHNGASHLKSK